MSERVESQELPAEALEIFAPPRDLQGRIHFHEGVLARKTAKLGSWKKGWYRVAPGELPLRKVFVHKPPNNVISGLLIHAYKVIARVHVHHG